MGETRVDAAEIRRRFEERVAGTPYAVTATRHGLEVGLDVADERWATLLAAHGLEVEHRVDLRLDEAARRYSADQVLREVTWTAGIGGGAPTARFSRSVARGTFVGTQVRADVGLHDTGNLVEGYRLDLSELTDLVREVMEPTGWERRLGTASRVGLVVGVIGAVGALAAVVAVLVVWLTGGFA